MNYEEITLDQLPVGSLATVTALSADCAARRRLLDFGLVSGTRVESLYRSPSGNPVAYLIRGAVIALRSDISSKILVTDPAR